MDFDKGKSESKIESQDPNFGDSFFNDQNADQ